MSELRRLLPSLNTLVAFEAAVRCGSFARAAKELGVTGPAVSRTIGRLELHLGMPLFHRTPSGAVLTKDGAVLFSGISNSFGEIERTLTQLRRDRVALRPVVLSVSSAFATHWFMPRLAKFQSLFPEEEIRFHLINGPLQGPVEGADIAMRFDPRPDDRHAVYPLMPELLLPVCAGHSAGARREAGALLPAAAKMITLSGSPFRWADLLAPEWIRSTTAEILLGDYTLVVQAALVGQGIAVGWFNVISSLLAQGALAPAASHVVQTERRCDLVIRKPRPKVVDDICDWIASEYREDAMLVGKAYPEIGASLRSHMAKGD